MKHTVREDPKGVVIAFSGDVDLEQSPTAKKILLQWVNADRGVVVDLSAVDYIDSSGIASLVEAYQAARQGKTAFALAAVSVAAMRVFALARLDKVFSMYPTVDAALEGVG